LAQQILIHGRPLTTEEVRERVDAVDKAAVSAFAAKALSGPPTLTMLGPVANAPDVEAIRRHIAA
jgi:predicted Zn-dependent peptidase